MPSDPPTTGDESGRRSNRRKQGQEGTEANQPRPTTTEVDKPELERDESVSSEELESVDG